MNGDEQRQTSKEIGVVDATLVEGSEAIEIEQNAAVPAVSRRGIWGALGWWLVLLGVQVYAGILAYIGCRIAGRKPTAIALFVGGDIAVLIVTAVAVGCCFGARARRALALRGCSPLHLLLVVLISAPLLVVALKASNWAAQGLDAFLGRSAIEASAASDALPLAILGITKSSPWDVWDEKLTEFAQQSWIILLVFGCLLPAAGEEVFFRGFLGRGLVARHGALLGVLFTSILFALAHVHPVQVCGTFMLGIALHLVFLCTKSLAAPVLLHALNNALDFSVAKLAVNGFDITGPDGMEHIPGWLFVAALGAVIALGLLLHTTRVCWVTPDGTPWFPGFATAETPPAALAAVPKLRRPRRAFNVFVALVYLTFALVFAHTVGSWRALAGANRGSVLIDEGNCEQAIVELNRAIALDPHLAWAFFNRGVAYDEEGDPDKAIADYTEAIRLNPEDPKAYYNRGVAYGTKGEKAKADKDFARANKLGYKPE